MNNAINNSSINETPGDLNPFSTELGGFTPLSDILTQEVGLVGCAVYGLVWRHCQMKEGVCYKTVRGLAQILRLNERTVHKWLKDLVKQGYLHKTKSFPNHYVVTGKVKARLAAGSPESDSEPTAKPGTRFRPDRNLNPANPESESDKETHEKTLEETIVGAGAPTPKKPHQEMFETLLRACRWELNFLTEDRRGQLNKVGKQLRDQGITPAEVERWLEAWYAHDWRGQRGQAPDNPQVILDNWAKFPPAPATGARPQKPPEPWETQVDKRYYEVRPA